MVSISKTLGKFICWVFQYNDCWKNLWKFLGVFLCLWYFQNIIEWACLTLGYTPYSIQDPLIFFLAVISFFDNTYFSKCSNHLETICKMVKCWHTLQRAGTTSRDSQT